MKDAFNKVQIDPVIALLSWASGLIAPLNHEDRQEIVRTIEILRKENKRLETENLELKKRAVIF